MLYNPISNDFVFYIELNHYLNISIAADLPLSLKFELFASFNIFIYVILAGYAGMVNSESDFNENLVKNFLKTCIVKIVSQILK